MTNYREILRLANLGINQTGIAISLGCARKTVRDVLRRASSLDIEWPLDPGMTDAELRQLLFPEKSESITERIIPNYDYIDKEMMRNGVTLKLLWNEYCEECRQKNDLPLMYSQFCHYYQKFRQKKRATMHIPRKPGEQIEVDWAGNPVHLVDTDTGELIPCYIFIGALNYSLYAYAEAFLAMDTESWITAHVHMYQHFGGSTKMLIPDNLKTGVEQADWFTPKINKTYHEMAEYYDTAVLPARVRMPKDKPTAEGTVKVFSNWVTAAMRNDKFFSLTELNREINRRLEEFNNKPFQKKEGSRYSIFLSEEKPFLKPLPSAHYELSLWKQATVQFNYHINVDKMQYSVPYEYIKQIVDVRLTKSTVEVFYHNQRICSHRRLYGHANQYSTVDSHMPESHQKYLQWDGKRFAEWADKVGPNTTSVVKAILASFKIEQQGYKSCMGLLKLADKYSINRLEEACKRALSYTPHPSYKSVKNILVSGLDKLNSQNQETAESSNDARESFGYTRGAGYYGGVSHDE